MISLEDFTIIWRLFQDDFTPAVVDGTIIGVNAEQPHHEGGTLKARYAERRYAWSLVRYDANNKMVWAMRLTYVKALPKLLPVISKHGDQQRLYRDLIYFKLKHQ